MPEMSSTFVKVMMQALCSQCRAKVQQGRCRCSPVPAEQSGCGRLVLHIELHSSLHLADSHPLAERAATAGRW